MSKFKSNVDIDGGLTLTGDISGSIIRASNVLVNGIQVATISGGGSADLTDYTLLTTTISLSSDLQNQIDSNTSLIDTISGNYLEESDLINLTSVIRTTSNISGSTFYGDGSNLTGIASGLSNTVDESSGAYKNGVRLGDVTNNVATGSFSIAEGKATIASGNYGAHAEGQYTQSLGLASHAEGNNTRACGDYSHAEGESSTANNDNAHAEGSSVASGFGSHAEGHSTASGSYSHAEGYRTLASETIYGGTHAEGKYTTASGGYSHAEGNHSIASMCYSHAEGAYTTALGYSSHAEGKTTLGKGMYSHAEGGHSTACGTWAHAEGTYAMALGDGSHAEGSSTMACGNYSHAEGFTPKALGSASHAEGNNTTASSNTSHAEGLSTIACGAYSHAEGLSTIASGVASHAGGNNAQSLSDNSFVWSDSTIFQDQGIKTFNVYATNGIYLSGGDLNVENNAIVNGDLTVQGTTITVNSETVLIQDNILTLNAGISAVTANEAGIEVYRNSNPKAQFLWNELTDTWQIGISGNLSNIVTTSTETSEFTSTIATGISGANVVIDSFTEGAGDVGEWLVSVKDGTNYRASKIIATWDGNGNIVHSENSTNDIGDTSDVIFNVDENANNIRLLMTSIQLWDIKTKRILL